MNQVNQTSTAIVSSIAIGKPGADLLFGRDFISFIWKEKANRRYLKITLVGSIIQFIILKLLFPFPDFISDSYNYIESAVLGLNVNLWPIGYAKFLWLIHQINYSDTFLVAMQYAILQISLLYFFYTIAYLLHPSGVSLKILFVFLIFNPMFLYLSNCVLSDALFSALTILWISQLLWLIHRPRMRYIIVAAILIALAFTIRYTAAYYPIVMGFALLFSSYKNWQRMAGTLVPLTLMIPFVLFTKAQTKAITGTAEFSVFGGWQLANNALYMYEHIDVDPQKLPAATVGLDAMVKEYYKKMPPDFFNFGAYPGTFFIKHQHAPLKQYMINNYSNELASNNFLAWGKVSPMYSQYGEYLISHHPIAFSRYYMWLNVKNYFLPFLEKFGSYNIGMDSVWNGPQYWFHWKSSNVKVISKKLQAVIFYLYSPTFMIFNLYFSGLLLWSLYRQKLKTVGVVFKKQLVLIIVFLLTNFFFSVFATPVVLRYQVIPFTLLFAFSLLLLEFTSQTIKETHGSTTK